MSLCIFACWVATVAPRVADVIGRVAFTGGVVSAMGDARPSVPAREDCGRVVAHCEGFYEGE